MGNWPALDRGVPEKGDLVAVGVLGDWNAGGVGEDEIGLRLEDLRLLLELLTDSSVSEESFNGAGRTLRFLFCDFRDSFLNKKGKLLVLELRFLVFDNISQLICSIFV